MRLFKCEHCGNPLYFENISCLECGHPVGFLADTLRIVTLSKIGTNTYQDVRHGDTLYHYCQNANHQVCNWVIPTEENSIYCRACTLNKIIPDLSNPENGQKWKQIEIAKHRLVYSLIRLGLPVRTENGFPIYDLTFEFKANTPEEKVMTGHAQGLITLNIDEADEAARTKHKLDMGERYRTLLGTFATKSDITTGMYSFRTPLTRRPTDNYLEMNPKIIAKPSRDIISREPLKTGPKNLSALMPRLIPGKTGPKPGRITST